ncbi:hypothetical protein EV702DRAFT_1224079 [Suillus placidus]|uniref:Uncharacterized protein n=1 Tax=Suillus placidus TaxID=48579 RepID=A0A9P7A6V7_9AGAM|nr:hypothetical protein EV702DRAFT_1224079 [Suillus placidus]
MATKSEAVDISTSVSCNPPPSYNAISTLVSADSIWSKLWGFSFLQSKQKYLSCIRAIVSSPDFTPSSIAQTVNACAATLPAAWFSKLLQHPNIEDHTALYWAIVNNRREALWVFMNFIPKLSPACSSDLRLACMMVNDHTLFTQLDLSEKLNPKDDSLRCFLGCPPDEIQVQELGNGCFTACFRFRMFQKRLRVTLDLGVEFVAGSRIWELWFYLGPEGEWCAGCLLSEHSLPVRADAVVFRIEAHRKSPDCATPEPQITATNPSMASGILVHEEWVHCSYSFEAEALIIPM